MLCPEISRKLYFFLVATKSLRIKRFKIKSEGTVVFLSENIYSYIAKPLDTASD